MMPLFQTTVSFILHIISEPICTEWKTRSSVRIGLRFCLQPFPPFHLLCLYNRSRSNRNSRNSSGKGSTSRGTAVNSSPSLQSIVGHVSNLSTCICMARFSIADSGHDSARQANTLAACWYTRYSIQYKFLAMRWGAVATLAY